MEEGRAGGVVARSAEEIFRFAVTLRSFLLPPSCRYLPTCSAFAHEAVGRHGAFHGTLLALGRLARCHPFRPGGFDPVP